MLNYNIQSRDINEFPQWPTSCKIMKMFSTNINFLFTVFRLYLSMNKCFLTVLVDDVNPIETSKSEVNSAKSLYTITFDHQN